MKLNLFAGPHKQSMILRLSDTDRAEFLKLGGTSDFEPMPGRKMKGYVHISDPLRRKRPVLAQWIQRIARVHTVATTNAAESCRRTS